MALLCWDSVCLVLLLLCCGGKSLILPLQRSRTFNNQACAGQTGWQRSASVGYDREVEQGIRRSTGSGVTSSVLPLLHDRATTLTGQQSYGNLSLSLTKLIVAPNPSYVQILKERILSITSFSLLRKGTIMQYDFDTLSTPTTTMTGGAPSEVTAPPKTLHGDYLWPNELSQFVDQSGCTVTLVPDGFLLPGQNDGGLYAIRDAHSAQQSRPIRITKSKPGWFHHKAAHVRLPGGREGILTARAHKPVFGRGRGELVWLAMPPKDTAWHSSCSVAEGDDDDDEQGIKIDGSTALDAPWDETVLATGPDVMFEVVDLDTEDDCIEVIAAHFFGSQLSVHSLRSTKVSPFVEVVSSHTMQTEGKPYGLCLASMPLPLSGAAEAAAAAGVAAVPPLPIDQESQLVHRTDRTQLSRPQTNSLPPPSHLLVSTHECSYDVHSAIGMAFAAIRGQYPRIKVGGASSFRNVERLPLGTGSLASQSAAGGSLFAYELPSSASRTRASSSSSSSLPASSHSHVSEAGDKNRSWRRHTLFRGFKVRGWGGIFSPGAPGFPYVFNMPGRPHAPPLILLAGDCTGSAYIFKPSASTTRSSTTSAQQSERLDFPSYELAFEVECGATVGSAAVLPSSDGTGDVEIFVPSYELNRVHAFRLHDDSPPTNLAEAS